MSLSLVSLNIERSKHIELVVPFLRERKPDVFCVQELSERDVSVFAEMFSYHAPFTAHSLYVSKEEGNAPQGVGIFSAFPIVDLITRYYVGNAATLPKTISGDSTTYLAGNRAVALATLEKEGVRYRIGTTHFTWSEKGRATDLQRTHLSQLFTSLEQENELVLCGDFNLPRGGELFSFLAKKYKDNIPQEYTTSIDVTLHRNRADDLDELKTKMVDGLFTTPEYMAKDVSLVSGVSDHMAIVATVEKTVTGR